MRRHAFLYKILLLGLPFLSVAQAEENALPLTAQIFQSLIKDLQQELETGRLVSQKERNQLYDVIGGLKMCLPAIYSVIEHQEKRPVEKEETKDSSKDKEDTSQARFIHRTVEEFKITKDDLIGKLREEKIPPEGLEAAYTLVGTLNLCLPIVKGAALLIQEIEKEKTFLSQQEKTKEEPR